MKNLIKLNKIFAFSFLFLTVNFAHSHENKIASVEEVQEEIKKELNDKLRGCVENIYVNYIENSNQSKPYQVTIELGENPNIQNVIDYFIENSDHKFSQLVISKIGIKEIDELFKAFMKFQGLENMEFIRDDAKENE